VTEPTPTPAPADRPFPFGPSALATPANFVTILRLLISPLLFGMIANKTASWGAFVLWVTLSLTDGVDGYLARRHGTTRSGAFLDPLADKVLVLGAMFVLVGVGRFWWLPVALIAVREIGISLFRSYYGRLGLAVPATMGAKVKTVVQAVAVGLAICPATDQIEWLADATLWAAVVLTLGTGMQYLLAGRQITTRRGDRS
jgi:CDP-diacylglycerol--glycerol-3-phosphate 3-phosphatidyltransferase